MNREQELVNFVNGIVDKVQNNVLNPINTLGLSDVAQRWLDTNLRAVENVLRTLITSNNKLYDSVSDEGIDIGIRPNLDEINHILRVLYSSLMRLGSDISRIYSNTRIYFEPHDDRDSSFGREQLLHTIANHIRGIASSIRDRPARGGKRRRRSLKKHPKRLSR